MPIKGLQFLLQGLKYVRLEIDAIAAAASALESQCLCGGCRERLLSSHNIWFM